jgi:hypothetical protein
MQAQPPGIFDNIQTFLYIAAAICLVVGGIYIGMQFNGDSSSTKTSGIIKTSGTIKPEPPAPGPSPQPNPNPSPYPPEPPAPGPAPQPSNNFKPTLELISAFYNPPSKEIKVTFKVDSDTPMPQTKTYSVNFTVEINNQPLSDVSEDEPIHQEDLGFKKEALLEVTGLKSKLQISEMVVKAQIHYYSDGVYSKEGPVRSIQVS